jgi:hypothetical protein
MSHESACLATLRQRCSYATFVQACTTRHLACSSTSIVNVTRAASLKHQPCAHLLHWKPASKHS